MESYRESPLCCKDRLCARAGLVQVFMDPAEEAEKFSWCSSVKKALLMSRSSPRKATPGQLPMDEFLSSGKSLTDKTTGKHHPGAIAGLRAAAASHTHRCLPSSSGCCKALRRPGPSQTAFPVEISTCFLQGFIAIPSETTLFIIIPLYSLAGEFLPYARTSLGNADHIYRSIFMH